MDDSIIVPSSKTCLVRVEYEPEPEFLSETLGVLAPNLQGEQTLFVHTHLAQTKLPWIRRIIDLETGQTIRVSESWLGGDSTQRQKKKKR